MRSPVISLVACEWVSPSYTLKRVLIRRGLFALSALLLFACSDCSGPDRARNALDGSSASDATIDASDASDAEPTAGDSSDAWFDGENDAADASVKLEHLSQTGLYRDIAAKKLSDGLHEFAPVNTLWADGSDKTRWISLPEGTKIDTSDMNHWKFPVGTKLFKEFAINGRRLETRLIERRSDTGDNERDFFFGAFVWRDDESDADLAPYGLDNVRGTDHEVPSQGRCWACHLGESGHILGFSALQLSRDNGLSLRWLIEHGWLSSPPDAAVNFAAPHPAAGYLHANCGHCHNELGIAWPDTQMVLRLGIEERVLTSSSLYTTTVGVPLQRWNHEPYAYRIVAGKPEESALVARMNDRANPRDQMPPLATKHPDPTGLALVGSWIASLPQ